jgi:hypothetical protein
MRRWRWVNHRSVAKMPPSPTMYNDRLYVPKYFVIKKANGGTFMRFVLAAAIGSSAPVHSISSDILHADGTLRRNAKHTQHRPNSDHKYRRYPHAHSSIVIISGSALHLHCICRHTQHPQLLLPLPPLIVSPSCLQFNVLNIPLTSVTVCQSSVVCRR